MLAELESRQEEDRPQPTDESEAERRRRRAKEVAEAAGKIARIEGGRRKERAGRRSALTERIVIKVFLGFMP